MPEGRGFRRRVKSVNNVLTVLSAVNTDCGNRRRAGQRSRQRNSVKTKKVRKLGIFIAAPASRFAPADLAALKRELSQLAFERGYTAYRGKRGSIFEFLAAIVGGEIAIVLLADEERSHAIKRLRQLEKTEKDYIARDAFRDIADALERAERREEEVN